MATPSPPSIMAVAAITAVTITFQAVSATWCIIRSEASEQALQKALDYACWAGADCEPIKSSGLCFLPNTLQAHASYAFNSYYQRKATAPGSCDFSGIATVAKTDPSYGSCVYPSTSSTAGGTIPPPITGTTTPTTIPIINAQPPPSNFGTEGVNPGRGPALPDTTPSNAYPMSSTMWMLIPLCFCLTLFFVM